MIFGRGVATLIFLVTYTIMALSLSWNFCLYHFSFRKIRCQAEGRDRNFIFGMGNVLGIISRRSLLKNYSHLGGWFLRSNYSYFRKVLNSIGLIAKFLFYVKYFIFRRFIIKYLTLPSYLIDSPNGLLRLLDTA